MQLPRALPHEMFAQSVLLGDPGVSPHSVGHGCSPPCSSGPPGTYGMIPYGGFQNLSQASFGALRKANGPVGPRGGGGGGGGGGGAGARREHDKPQHWPEHTGREDVLSFAVGRAESWQDQETVLRPLQHSRLVKCGGRGGGGDGATASDAAYGCFQQQQQQQEHCEEEEDANQGMAQERVSGNRTMRKVATANRAWSRTPLSRGAVDDAVQPRTRMLASGPTSQPPQSSPQLLQPQQRLQESQFFDLRPQPTSREMYPQQQVSDSFVLDRNVLTKLLLAGAAARRRQSNSTGGQGSGVQPHFRDHQMGDKGYATWHRTGQPGADEDAGADISSGLPNQNTIAPVTAAAAATAAAVRCNNSASAAWDDWLEKPQMEGPGHPADRESYGYDVMYDMQDELESGPEKILWHALRRKHMVQQHQQQLRQQHQQQELESELGKGKRHGVMDTDGAQENGAPQRPHGSSPGLQLRRLQPRTTMYVGPGAAAAPPAPAVASDVTTRRQAPLPHGGRSPADSTPILPSPQPPLATASGVVPPAVSAQRLPYIPAAPTAHYLPPDVPGSCKNGAVALETSGSPTLPAHVAPGLGPTSACKSGSAAAPEPSMAKASQVQQVATQSLTGSAGGGAPGRTRRLTSAGDATAANAPGRAAGQRAGSGTASRGAVRRPSLASADATAFAAAGLEAGEAKPTALEAEASDLHLAAEVLLLLRDGLQDEGNRNADGAGGGEMKEHSARGSRSQLLARKRKAADGHNVEAAPPHQAPAAVQDARHISAGLEDGDRGQGEQVEGAARPVKRVRCAGAALEVLGGRRSGSLGSSSGCQKAAHAYTDDIAHLAIRNGYHPTSHCNAIMTDAPLCQQARLSDGGARNAALGAGGSGVGRGGASRQLSRPSPASEFRAGVLSPDSVLYPSSVVPSCGGYDGSMEWETDPHRAQSQQGRPQERPWQGHPGGGPRSQQQQEVKKEEEEESLSGLLRGGTLEKHNQIQMLQQHQMQMQQPGFLHRPLQRNPQEPQGPRLEQRQKEGDEEKEEELRPQAQKPQLKKQQQLQQQPRQRQQEQDWKSLVHPHNAQQQPHQQPQHRPSNKREEHQLPPPQQQQQPQQQQSVSRRKQRQRQEQEGQEEQEPRPQPRGHCLGSPTALSPSSVQVSSPDEPHVALVDRFLPNPTRKPAAPLGKSTTLTSLATASAAAPAPAQAASGGSFPRDVWPRLLSSTLAAAPPPTTHELQDKYTHKDHRVDQPDGNSPREYDSAAWCHTYPVSSPLGLHAQPESRMFPGNLRPQVPLAAFVQGDGRDLDDSGADAWAIVQGRVRRGSGIDGSIVKAGDAGSTQYDCTASWEVLQPARSFHNSEQIIHRHLSAAVRDSGLSPASIHTGFELTGDHQPSATSRQQHSLSAWRQHQQQKQQQQSLLPGQTTAARKSARLDLRERPGLQVTNAAELKPPLPPPKREIMQKEFFNPSGQRQQLLRQQQRQHGEEAEGDEEDQADAEAWPRVQVGMRLSPHSSAVAGVATPIGTGPDSNDAVMASEAVTGRAAVTSARPRAAATAGPEVMQEDMADICVFGPRRGLQPLTQTQQAHQENRSRERRRERLLHPKQQQQQQPMEQQLRQLILEKHQQMERLIGSNQVPGSMDVDADAACSGFHYSGSGLAAHNQHDGFGCLEEDSQPCIGAVRLYGTDRSSLAMGAAMRNLASVVRAGAAASGHAGSRALVVPERHDGQQQSRNDAGAEGSGARVTAKSSWDLAVDLRTGCTVHGTIMTARTSCPGTAVAAGPTADMGTEPGLPNTGAASPTGESTEIHITTRPPAPVTAVADAAGDGGGYGGGDSRGTIPAAVRNRPESQRRRQGAMQKQNAAISSGDGEYDGEGPDGQDKNCRLRSGGRASTRGSGGGGGGATAAAPSTAAPAAGGRGSGVEITMEDLRQTFVLPAPEAARVLRTSTTNLKRKCRQLGILRWPHRKLDSLHRLRTLVLNEVKDAREQQALLDSIARNTQQILQDPNLGLIPALKNLRQAYYKRGFDVRVRGLGRTAGTADSDDSM